MACFERRARNRVPHMYRYYQSYADMTDPVRMLAANAERILQAWGSNVTASPLKRMAAYYELVNLAGFTHARPDFAITSVDVRGETVPVIETLELDMDFCSLVRFHRANAEAAPKVLLMAPMSGHFATLLRGTIKTLLKDYDVYVSDWKNVRDIPLSAGPFDLDDYIEHIIKFIKFMGPETHVVAVCQPTVPALAAVALMAQDKENDQPASLTLMAGPIDTRISPTKVNELANAHPIEWFRDKLVGVVPHSLKGAGRNVYPGFLQLAAFMSMNPERHAKSFADLFKHRIEGEFEKADAIRDFYKEYFAIMDLSGEFYLQTIKSIFQDYDLPLGKLMYRGRVIEPRAIKKTFLLTVEGERDDICAIGQTMAAQDLCSGLRPYMKSHHMEPGAGHYGVFNGRRWDNRIYPVLRSHIQSSV
ncbi:MAG: poly(3-hydroxybutyrate) depolymerase [Hyphomicrobiales bacterium]|jgi:poly(3-hydroxybutyrate) depolymerase|nr:poly(3-hydroxybutyrate) depolymerase [Hyphomicrobiales bacterium]